MDQLEDQVSDLRYLTQNPITPLAETPAFSPQTLNSPSSAVPGLNSAHHQKQRLNSAGDATTPTTSSNTAAGAKRKNDEVDGPSQKEKQQRSKRNRYISIAW